MNFLIGQKVVICGKAIGKVVMPENKNLPNTDEDIWVDSPIHGGAFRFSAANIKPYVYPTTQKSDFVTNNPELFNICISDKQRLKLIAALKALPAEPADDYSEFDTDNANSLAGMLESAVPGGGVNCFTL